jgi:hypothetical protein
MNVAMQIPSPGNQSAPVPISNPIPNAGETYKQSEATRLLCAAAYLDRSFRKEVVKAYIDEEHRAIAPSFGIDQTMVIQHCVNAHKKLDRREIWLLIPGILGIITAIAVANDQTTAFPILLIAYLAAVAFVFTYRRRADAIVRENFVRGKFDPNATNPDLDVNLEYIRGMENGNVLIYSGFTPFVGSGLNLNGWSFALDLRKTCDANGQPLRAESSVDRITVQELYERVDQDIRALDLERVTVEDKLYINGKDIRDDRRFLSDPLSRPKNEVDDQVVSKVMAEPSHQLRHYRCIRVVDWSGELVLSIFFRFAKLRHNLFVEASYFLLTPIAENYRKVDSLGQSSTAKKIIGDLLFAVIATPFLQIYSPLAVLGIIQEKLQEGSHRKAQETEILENPSFDYGASLSLRQRTSSDHYRRYFQKLDEDMYAKILEKTILDSIVTILEERNIDVSELKQRQTTILNNGVMVSGGNITTDNLAVGQGAKIGHKIAQVAAKATNA